MHAGDARVVQRELRGAPKVELAVGDDLLAEAVAVRLCDVVAYLVAARARGRPDRGVKLAAQCFGGRCEDPGEDADPARVGHGDPGLGAAAGECDRNAVRGQGGDREPGDVRPERVALRLAAHPGLAPVHDRAVHLVVQRQVVRVGAELGAEDAAVLVHSLDVVTGPPAEVERRVRPRAHPTAPGRERDAVRAGNVPADQIGVSRRRSAPAQL